MGIKRTSNRPRFVWEQLVKEFEANHCSAKSFCEKHELALSTFHGWRKKLEREDFEEVQGGGFIPVTLAEEGSALEGEPQEPFHIKVGGRFEMWIPASFQEAPLKRLLKVLTTC